MIKFIQEIRSKNPKEKRNLTLKSIYILLISLVLGIGGVKGQSTNLVSWDFTTSVSNANYATNSTNQNGARSTALTNVTFSTISIVGGATGVNANTFHRTTSWSAASDNGRYLQFSIDLTSGETFANQSISVAIGAQVSSTTTAARNYTVTYGYGASPTFATATNGAVTGTGTSTTNTTNISIPAPGNTTTTSLTVRILVFGSSGAGNFRLATIGLTGYTPLSSSPAINASVSTLPSFVSSGISSPSTEQSFTVSGTNLTNNITITPPTGYQVSTTSGSGFGSSVVLNQSGGTVASTTVYARFNPSALTDQVGGNITCASTGATTQNIALTGEVTNLSAGAISFIAFQGATTDYFRIVALEDIPANTRIWITDNEWDGSLGTPAFTAGEGNTVWTSPGTTLTRGSVVEFAVTAGTVTTGSGAFTSGLSSTQEQLFAYQGLSSNPSFIAGYTTGATINVGTPTDVNTWVPAGLTSGTNFVALAGTLGSSYLTNSTINLSLTDMRSHLHNVSNITSNVSTTYSSWPTYTFNFIADEPTSQPSFTAASNVGNNQMDLNFSGGNGTSYIVVMREGTAVDATPTDATNYSTVSGSVNFSTATELSAGQRIVYNGTTSTGTVTVTNLSPGTTYHYAIYAYNGTTTTANFYLTSPGTGSQLTTGSANSNTSDIIVSASFTEPSNIAYSSNQENSDLTFGNSVEVAQFTLRDGGATTDGDANSTIINSITFAISNHIALRRLALYDGSTELAEVAISSGTATFSGLTLAANDNGSNDFSLRASFAGTIADNTQFSFTVSSVTADIAGSTFSAADAGAAVTSTTTDRNKIEVTATLLAFVQNTSNVSVLTAMSPAPTVSANDALGNRDLDYVTDMEVTTSGTFAGAATITETPIAGLATFDNLQFQDAETGINIAVSSGVLTPSGNSNDFDITISIGTGDFAFVKYQSDAPDEFSIINFVDIPASQTFYFTDNQWTTASGPLASNEQTMTWTTPSSIIPAGTVITFSNPTGSTTNVTPAGNGTGTNALNGIAAAGDQIFMYKGTSGSPTQFICGLNFGNTGAWQTSAGTSANSSFLPSDLTNNVNAVSFSSELDNGYYSNTMTGSVATLKSLINNGANWTRNDALQSAPTWSFNLNSTTTTISSSTIVQNLSLEASETFVIGANTLTINGTVSGDGTITGGTTSNLTIGGPAGTVQFTSGSNNNYLRNLTLNASSSMTIGNALNITGGATPGVVAIASGATLNTAGNLTLKSDASGTASIGNSAGTISGNVTVERFIPRRRAFRFLASPVNITNFISGSWQQATHITGSLTGANGFDQSNSGTASLFTYNVGTEAWTTIPNTNSTNLNIGTGYRMLVRGDRNINLNTTTPQDSAALVLSATGSVVTGDVVFGGGSVSSSPAGIPSLNSTVSTGINGWTLIGNPYASAVNWANVTKSNVSTTFATWNVNNAGRGSYVYHNGTTGTGNGNSNIINSGQSIFVQTTDVNPSITFTEASKVTSTPPSHFKKSLSDVLNIDIFIGDRAYDALTVMFDANNSNNYDAQDFIKLVNPEINFYSYLADGTKLAMNSMKEITSETIVPLGLNGVFNGGSYELKFTNQNTFTNANVYLKDKFINKTYDLKSINNLTFTVTTDSNSFGENRFELIFSKSATGLNNELSSNNNNFIVFPNPVNNVLNLSLTTTKEDNYSFTIFNQLGEMVNNGSLDFNSKRTHALNIENLNNGVYFIQVKNGKSTQTIKFIK